MSVRRCDSCGGLWTSDARAAAARRADTAPRARAARGTRTACWTRARFDSDARGTCTSMCSISNCDPVHPPLGRSAPYTSTWRSNRSAAAAAAASLRCSTRRRSHCRRARPPPLQEQLTVARDQRGSRRWRQHVRGRSRQQRARTARGSPVAHRFGWGVRAPPRRPCWQWAAEAEAKGYPPPNGRSGAQSSSRELSGATPACEVEVGIRLRSSHRWNTELRRESSWSRSSSPPAPVDARLVAETAGEACDSLLGFDCGPVSDQSPRRRTRRDRSCNTALVSCSCRASGQIARALRVDQIERIRWVGSEQLLAARRKLQRGDALRAGGMRRGPHQSTCLEDRHRVAGGEHRVGREAGHKALHAVARRSSARGARGECSPVVEPNAAVRTGDGEQRPERMQTHRSDWAAAIDQHVEVAAMAEKRRVGF